MKARLSVTLVAMLLVASTSSATWASALTGACCFQSGACQELTSFQCGDSGGDYIGDDVPCAAVNCRAGVVAPLLSGASLVAAASALAGIGALRAIRRRRAL